MKTKNGRVRDFGPLTKKERDALKIKIANFCREKPRTYKEVSRKFNISGISAAALLKDDIFNCDEETETFQTRKES